MRLELAQVIARRLARRLMPDLPPEQADQLVVGSVRRESRNPRDIEVIVPLMSPMRDEIYDRINALVEVGTCTAVKGLKPGFKYCQLACDGEHRAWAALQSGDFKIDVFRYDEGSDAGGPSNRGWIELMRTGPAEFGQACLAHFKRRGGQGSKDGFLIDAQGERIHTPDEASAFEALGVAMLLPWQRVDAASVVAVDGPSYHRTVTDREIPF